MKDDRRPSLSVVLLTPDRYDRIRKVMWLLRQQTVSQDLEILIVSPAYERLGIEDGELNGFFEVKFVDVGVLKSTGGARTEGVLRASAPVTGFAEDHAFFEREWAQAMVEAHRQPWAGVGAAMTNANPGTSWSWAEHYLNFGPSIPPLSAAPAESIPWHNSTYKTAVLKECGEDLEMMLETEGLLHLDLLGRGHRLFQTADARTSHVNPSLWRSFMSGQYWGTRLFWSARARFNRWSFLKRFAIACCTPFLLLVRLSKALQQIHRTGRLRSLFASIVPALLLGSVAGVAGAAAGLLFGPGEGIRHRLDIELYRVRHLRREDQQLLSTET